MQTSARKCTKPKIITIQETTTTKQATSSTTMHRYVSVIYKLVKIVANVTTSAIDFSILQKSEANL
ncbi:hypothetical protein Leryth_002337 [Lithospermum erythrorhizon]|nr:hypothetical protein Leryth_002337 [Lithospermum erythrorhizon]